MRARSNLMTGDFQFKGIYSWFTKYIKFWVGQGSIELKKRERTCQHSHNC